MVKLRTKRTWVSGGAEDVGDVRVWWERFRSSQRVWRDERVLTLSARASS